MDVISPILFHARHNPQALALCAPGVDLVTYGQLEKSVNNISRRARSLGLAAGHVVGVLLPKHPTIHAVLILGLARLGVITISVGPRKLPHSLRLDAMVCDGPHPHANVRTIPFDPSWLAGDGRPPEVDHAPGDDDITRIILTSGTTGEPKAVALSHRMVFGRVLRYHALCGNVFPSRARVFCDVTLATSFGYTIFISTLLKGGAFFTRGNTGENTLRALDFYNVDAFVVAPGSLPELLAEHDKHRSQHTFDVILTGGSILSASLAERVASRMGSNLIAAYGSAETSLVASAPAHAVRNLPGAVGYVTPGMRVEIVDETDRPMPIGESGIVRIRGDYMASGYYNDAESSARIFRDGWFYPGDVGALTLDGVFVVAGRQTAVLNLGGEKIAPEAIEELVAGFDPAAAAGAALVSAVDGVDQIWVAIESAKTIDLQRLREHCRKQLPTIFTPTRFVSVERLPRNAMGKLDRGELLRLLKAAAVGAHDAPGAQTP
ncbi:MAG TPA: class I adenylate-forming enzyme family protein [Xanthobacteraceae bacterium]|jgi:acyl-CoA synthetase (AMP-forming)/AMP-acid ligase II|nr:class I adenylate-forming enzyme family protein [Xanthobacteraceae bacterium]